MSFLEILGLPRYWGNVNICMKNHLNLRRKKASFKAYAIFHFFLYFWSKSAMRNTVTKYFFRLMPFSVGRTRMDDKLRINHYHLLLRKFHNFYWKKVSWDQMKITKFGNSFFISLKYEIRITDMSGVCVIG